MFPFTPQLKEMARTMLQLLGWCLEWHCGLEPCCTSLGWKSTYVWSEICGLPFFHTNTFKFWSLRSGNLTLQIDTGVDLCWNETKTTKWKANLMITRLLTFITPIMTLYRRPFLWISILSRRSLLWRFSECLYIPDTLDEEWPTLPTDIYLIGAAAPLVSY